MSDFYVEVIHDPTQKKNPDQMRCFTVENIDDYLQQVNITESINLLNNQNK